MDKEKFYVRNKMLTYRDISSNIYLEVSIDAFSEANGRWKNLGQASIGFSLYDPKVNRNISIIGICLRYENAVRLFESVNGLFANSSSKTNIFSNGSVIQISQYTMKNRKELIFNFATNQNNQPIVQLTIIDTSSQRGRTTINLDLNAFKAIGKILKEFVETPIATNIGIKQLLAYDRILEAFESMKNDICVNINNVSKVITPKDQIDINEFPPDTQYEETELQKELQEEFKSSKGFSNVDLGLEKIKDNSSEVENFTKVYQPFISTCLNHDLDRLKSFITSFICTTEKSSEELFAPLDLIFNSSDVDIDERDQYTKTFGYYPVQFIMIYLLKKCIREAVQSGTFTNHIPALRFGTIFKRNTEMYKLSKEIITIFLLYSIIVNRFKDETDEIKRTYFAMKLLFSPFMFSIEVHDGLTDELCVEYDKCSESGMFQKMQNDYTSESYGGQLGINKEIFENCCSSFVKTLKEKETMIFDSVNGITDITKEFKIPIPMKPIESGSDIKRAIFEGPTIPLEPVKVDEPMKEIKIDKEELEADSKLDLFLESIKGIADNNLINGIKKNCNKFTDLPKFFKTVDIPEELFKIKRVIDIDPSLNRMQILKKAKLLKEDIDVTENRVMQDIDDSNYNESIDVQNILSMDDI